MTPPAAEWMIFIDIVLLNILIHIKIGLIIVYYMEVCYNCYDDEVMLANERRFGFMMIENEKWSSIEEVAEHIKVNKDTIRLWIKKGEIPARKIGRLWRFKISEIDEWVRSGKSADINKSSN